MQVRNIQVLSRIRSSKQDFHDFFFRSSPQDSLFKSTVNAVAALGTDCLALGMEDGTVAFLATTGDSFRAVGRPIAHISSVKVIAVCQVTQTTFHMAFGGGRGRVVIYRLRVSPGTRMPDNYE